MERWLEAVVDDGIADVDSACRMQKMVQLSVYQHILPLFSSSIEHSFPDLVLQWFRMFVNYQKMRADSLTSLHCGFIGVFDKGVCF